MTDSSGLSGTSQVNKFFQRPKLHEATFILPETGRRVRRNVTFGTLSYEVGSNEQHANERAPLLGKRESKDKWLDLHAKCKKYAKNTWSFWNSKTGRGVFKCSIAYLLGSLGTFVPVFARFLGHQDGKHIVATVTVYYHPARSKGSTVEAFFCALGAYAYTAVISFSSMGVSILFGRTLDLIVVGHFIVLILFCGGGLGFVGWVKQRMSQPNINISCSLACLALITVLTKEGAVQAAAFSGEKVVQVLKMILMGVFATTLVSFLVFPISARRELKKDLIEITDSFSDLLTMITRAFLDGSEEQLKQDSYVEASKKNKKVFTSLTKDLKDAKYEYYIVGKERQYQMHTKLANCMQRLTHSLGGLRSAATTEFLLLSQAGFTGKSTPMSTGIAPTPSSSSMTSLLNCSLSPSEDHHLIATSLNETPDGEVTDGGQTIRQFSGAETPGGSIYTSTSDIFTKFIMHLGPSMKSLAITLKQILDELPYTPDGKVAVNAHFTKSLQDAIELYTNSRKIALAFLYRQKELIRAGSGELEAEHEEVAASCGYFSFSLLDFANEMMAYLELLDELKLEIEERPKGRTWTWLYIWRYSYNSKVDWKKSDPERHELIVEHEETDVPADLPHPTERKSTIQFQAHLQSQWSFRYRVWRALAFFRRDDIKFAIKVGIGAALYALPSFLVSTRPFYQHWRGEWGLLSYMLVCSMTIGSSNTTGFARFFGTVLGAFCAIAAWEIADGNVYVLAFFGWFMSLWTAYIVVAMGKGPMGRFIMLTYNLSALYAYSMSVKDGFEDDDMGGLDPVITEITLHRTVAVITGVIWGLIITRLVWPISARRKLVDGLSKLWLRMGLIWKRDPLHVLVDPSISRQYMDLREEFELHRYLSRLESLRGSAVSEMDLRGPFPDENYSKALKSTGAMLDAFHAMNVAILKNPRATEGEAKLLKYTINERSQLCARISHLFQVLASSMKLQFPMNKEAFPSVEHTRDRLLEKIFRFRRDEKDRAKASEEDFELLYAYALVTGQISKEITDIGKEIERLFGVLDEDMLKLQ